MSLTIREAGEDDLSDILRLVHDLAVYEKEPDAVEATEADFAAVMFPTDGHPNTYGLVAEVDGEVIGIAIWFHSFSTWTGRNGIWLKDCLSRHTSGYHGAHDTSSRLHAHIPGQRWARVRGGHPTEAHSCTHRGPMGGPWYEEYTDNSVSASKARGKGTAWAKMLAAAERNEFDVIVAVDLDRLLQADERPRDPHRHGRKDRHRRRRGRPQLCRR